MPIFLILSSLGVLFYVGLLVALYRDSKRRNFDHPSVRKVSLGVVAQIDSEQASDGDELARPRTKPVNLGLQPMVSTYWQSPDQRGGDVKPNRTVSPRVPSGRISA
ncbi:MAG TPA: hypothetical protein VE779_12450 [Candidatus Angelobacter sp.]|jgi:hypothetical protein|nr:hypothetical protein [Candidatus Angelobacter sp.]